MTFLFIDSSLLFPLIIFSRSSVLKLRRIIGYFPKAMATATTESAPNTKPSVYLQDENEVEKVFQRFDTNRDGKISEEELEGVMRSLGTETSGDEVKRMMQEIDTDKDGFISLEEFAAFCKGDSLYGGADGAGTGDGGAKELRDAFDLYDQDHDGFISAKELHQILIRLGERCSEDDCATMIKSVDSDGDGSVSFDEFKKMMTNKP